ncbi:MAG: hypothetical protein Fur0035_22280 [Anaerolineales bacterium]
MRHVALFDLGDTLMHPLGDWPATLERADHALAESLAAAGLPLEVDSFHQELTQTLKHYYRKRDRLQIETSIFRVVRELLEKKGHLDPPPALIQQALRARYAITQQNWQLEDDSLACLSALREKGLRLGLVSNAGDHQDVLDLTQKFGIAHFFDLILTSAACGFRKPNPRIFEQALAHWKISPNQALMVGDRLDTDIAGAKALGIYAVWLTRRTLRPALIDPLPDAEIASLAELPALCGASL